ncbi:MAG: hypothetical protein OEU46_12935, partial [Alphaproteobacteria bacterium]|nr:hypothetical protein [Alphaproteobacteria bacterium]
EPDSHRQRRNIGRKRHEICQRRSDRPERSGRRNVGASKGSVGDPKPEFLCNRSELSFGSIPAVQTSN